MFNALTLLMASPEGGQTSLLPMVIMWGAIIGIFYFLLIRPQKKAQDRHQAMVEGLQKGDDIMTDGGIIGEVIHLKDDRVTVKTANDTRVEVARGKIARVFGKEEEES